MQLKEADFFEMQTMFPRIKYYPFFGREFLFSVQISNSSLFGCDYINITNGAPCSASPVFSTYE